MHFSEATSPTKSKQRLNTGRFALPIVSRDSSGIVSPLVLSGTISGSAKKEKRAAEWVWGGKWRPLWKERGGDVEEIAKLWRKEDIARAVNLLDSSQVLWLESCKICAKFEFPRVSLSQKEANQSGKATLVDSARLTTFARYREKESPTQEAVS